MPRLQPGTKAKLLPYGQARGDRAEGDDRQDELRQGGVASLHDEITQRQDANSTDRKHNRIADDEIPPESAEAADVFHSAAPAATARRAWRALSIRTMR